MIIIFFFFSSRRRHTRLTCDWSSDVCSSDLGVQADEGRTDPVQEDGLAAELPELLPLRGGPRGDPHLALAHEQERGGPEVGGRGEERPLIHPQLEVLEADREAVRAEALRIEGEVD